MLYQGGSIMVTALIRMTGQFTRENAIVRFRAHPDAAQAAGLPKRLVIGAGQHRERQWALGSLSIRLFFIAVIWPLTRLAVIIGIDVLCGWSQLPVIFPVTSASRPESLLAIPLLVLGVAFFGFSFAVVRAEVGPVAAYPHMDLVGSVMPGVAHPHLAAAASLSLASSPSHPAPLTALLSPHFFSHRSRILKRGASVTSRPRLEERCKCRVGDLGREAHLHRICGAPQVPVSH